LALAEEGEMSDGQSVVFPLVVALSCVSFVVAAIAYFRSEKEPEGLQRRFLPRFYAYAVLFISSLVLLVGGALLLKAAFSYPLGLEFSYSGQPIYGVARYPVPRTYPEPAQPAQFERLEYREEWRVSDLLNGATLVGTAGLFLALHWILRNRLESREERSVSFLNRAYLMVSGVVYGGLSLVLIPTSLRQLIEFYFVPRGDPETTVWSWPIPGDSLGYALMSPSLWLWAVSVLFRNRGSERAEV
jgi:hypothetical protein